MVGPRPDKPPPPPRGAICHACGRAVTWIRFPDGLARTVEACAAGTGDVALQADLFGGATVAQFTTTIGTSHRLHEGHCVRRGRWIPLLCATCRAPMKKLIDRRSMCATCQARERAALAAATAALVEKFGAEVAAAEVVCILQRGSKRR